MHRNKIDEYAMRDIELYFPFVADKAVSYIQRNKYEVVVYLSDCTAVSYDVRNRTIRSLPRDQYSMNKEEFQTEFGYRLWSVMYYHNITQEELAEKTGLKQPQISSYIRGNNIPNFYTVDKIARAIGCSTDDLRFIG